MTSSAAIVGSRSSYSVRRQSAAMFNAIVEEPGLTLELDVLVTTSSIKDLQRDLAFELMHF